MQPFIQYRLFGRSPDGEAEECGILIYAPEAADVDFVGRAEIEGLGHDLSFPSVGIDPIQALLMSISGVCNMIRRYERNGWTFYLSSERNDDCLFKSEVWLSTANRLFAEPEQYGEPS